MEPVTSLFGSIFFYFFFFTVFSAFLLLFITLLPEVTGLVAPRQDTCRMQRTCWEAAMGMLAQHCTLPLFTTRGITTFNRALASYPLHTAAFSFLESTVWFQNPFILSELIRDCSMNIRRSFSIRMKFLLWHLSGKKPLQK